MTEPVDHYEVLQVSPDASADVIRAAWVALAKAYHPDRRPDGAERMKAINNAWEVLGSPTRRDAYDRERAEQAERTAVTSEPTLGTQGWGEVVEDRPPSRPPSSSPTFFTFMPTPPSPPPRTIWPPPPPRATRRTTKPAPSMWARAAILCAIFGMSSLAYVLGPLAVWLGRKAIEELDLRPAPTRGRRLAQVAVVLGALEFVFALLYLFTFLE